MTTKRNNPMPRTFAYSRCSTSEQNTDNQFSVIQNKGYDIPEYRQVAEIVSGGVPAKLRPEFSKLLEKLEPSDTLIVAKIDRLGRDNIDVQQTIIELAGKGIKVVSLDLPTSDLTSSEGKLMLQMFTAFAEFEKNRIRERTMDGLAQAKKDGKKLGRPVATKTTVLVQNSKGKGLSQSQAAEELGVSLPTVKRHWNK
jgi:putative DNA-invertase from lambdoid prophage Rac